MSGIEDERDALEHHYHENVPEVQRGIHVDERNSTTALEHEALAVTTFIDFVTIQHITKELTSSRKPEGH